MKLFAGTFLFLLAANCVFSVSPQFWEEYTQEHFADGDPQFVSITSDGEILLAPQLKKIVDGTESIIWKIVQDSQNNIYAATGNEGKILKIDTAGKVSVVFDTNELEVQTLLVDKDDVLYAATSPDGKIYRIPKNGTGAVFFDPPDKYIWSLIADGSGNIYAGTGDQGRIYKIDSKGKGEVFEDTSETNITALAWDKQKALLAGSDKNGILYRIDQAGKAFVLFDSDLQQITSVYVDSEGYVYFAAISSATPTIESKTVSESTPQVQVPAPTTTSPQAPVEPDQEPEAEVTTSVEVSPVITVTPTVTPQKITGVSELNRINPDGSIEQVYVSAQDQILDIAEYKSDQVLVSTGRKAKLILVDKNRKSTILLKTPEEQITSLLHSGQILVATANPGNIYRLVEQHSAKGTYFSDVKDTLTSSTWGRISWKTNAPAGTQIQIFTRSGNARTPDETWSDWQAAGIDPSGKQISNPKSRFIQWKAELSTADQKLTPVLRKVTIAYLQQNLRPEVLSITIHPPGTVYRRAAIYPQESFAGLAQDNAESNQDLSEAGIQVPAGMEASMLGKKERRRGFQTVTWSAVDQNQDSLRYELQYKMTSETDWKPLAKELTEPIFTWDTQTIPDGTYTLRLIASDRGSNPSEYSLSASKESRPFEVDNTAPLVQFVKNSNDKGTRVVEVRAQDQLSAIKDMQYSSQPGVWKTIFPIDSINDSPVETYRIQLTAATAKMLVLKCTDLADNIATVKLDLP